MHNITVICVGKLKEKYLKDAIAEYEKRLTSFCRFSVIEVDEEKLPDNYSDSNIKAVIEKEGTKIATKIPNGAYVVSLCIEGKQFSSVEFSDIIRSSAVNGYSNVVFIIGGSYGLADEIKKQSNIKLSFSKMTFPHQLFRVMLIEQIYRSFQIINGGKYHK